MGAQAVYVRAATLADYQPYTTDADVAIDPTLLEPRPGLEDVMRSAGFRLKNQQSGHPEPGVWEARVVVAGNEMVVPVDIIVPEAVARPGGRRGARLGDVHGRRAAPAVPRGSKAPWWTTHRSRGPPRTMPMSGGSS